MTRAGHAASSRRPTPRRRASVMFAPIEPRRAHEYVAEQIRRHIALRLVRPGEALPSERELASMFGVGRPTVQKALRLLEADRLVDTRRGRHGGSFVVGPAQDGPVLDELIARVRRERDRLAEALVFRRAVEPATARIAARTRRKADVTAMRSAAEHMAAATVEDEYIRHDSALHLAVAAATRNRFLVRAAEEVRVALTDAIVLLPESDLWHRRIDAEHETIIAAIEGRDAHAAADAMEAHVANAEQGLRAVLAAVRKATGEEGP